MENGIVKPSIERRLTSSFIAHTESQSLACRVQNDIFPSDIRIKLLVSFLRRKQSGELERQSLEAPHIHRVVT